MLIAEAHKSIGRAVSLVGVAVESTVPKTTRGTDCFCAVRIIDESHTSGIRIHFFFQTMKELDLVRHVGDIVVVSNVKIETRKNEHDPNENYVYAKFNKYRPSFALFEGGGAFATHVSYRKSEKFRLNREQMDSITELRRCAIADRIEGIFETVSMNEIEENKDLNLICKILHIAQVDGNKYVLFIWNGTDTPTLRINATLEDEIKNPLPLSLEPLPNDILCTFPSVGSIVKITVDEGEQKLGVQYLKTGKWMKLIKIKFQTHSAMWCGVLTPESKFYYFPNDHNTAIQCQMSYEERKLHKWLRWPIKRSPLTSFITEIDHGHELPMTLMHVLTSTRVPICFRCIVRVVAVSGMLPDDDGMRLTLEDPTARLHAFLFREEMVEFFWDLESVEVVNEKMRKLVGLKESRNERFPPWMDCCLHCYYTNENDKLGSRKYRIYSTRMK